MCNHQVKFIFIFIFLWIINENFIVYKNRPKYTRNVLWEKYNQETKLQCSSDQKWTNKKMFVKLNSTQAKLHLRIECSHPSKRLAFHSLQIHHIIQCGTNLDKALLRCRLKLPCHDDNTTVNLCGITQ